MAATYVEMETLAVRLPELLNVVSEGGEVVITRGDQPIAKLVGYIPPSHAIRQPGTAKGLITLTDDWDAPLEDFDEYRRSDCCSIRRRLSTSSWTARR